MNRAANGKSNLLIKITLDILLIAILITLYSKNVISLMYHEIAGLALTGLFILHLVFNRKWIASTLKKIRQKKLPTRTRALSLVNALLAVSWLAVMVTGMEAYRGIPAMGMPRIAMLEIVYLAASRSASLI